MQGVPRLTRAELAELDRIASEEYRLPIAVLMENAGRSAAVEILRLRHEGEAKGKGQGPVVVLVGPGNNGGDACVVVRHLANEGVALAVFAATSAREREKVEGSPRSAAADMRRALDRMGIHVDTVSDESGLDRLAASLGRAGVIVDGLLGTGFRGEVRPEIARLIDATNAVRRDARAIVVALDLPSGLDADTGHPSRSTVIADVTVTFAAWKVGFDAPEAQPYLGRIVVATIGAPAELAERVRGAHPDRVPGRSRSARGDPAAP